MHTWVGSVVGTSPLGIPDAHLSLKGSLENLLNVNAGKTHSLEHQTTPSCPQKYNRKGLTVDSSWVFGLVGVGLSFF